MDERRSPADRRDLRYRALADPTRRHLLRILDDSSTPVPLDALSARVGLHVNTVRDHLNLLADAELVTRTTLPRTVPGRPRVAFQAVPRDARSPAAEGYRFLAQVLADSLLSMTDSPSAVATEAGRASGLELVDRHPADPPLPPEEAVEQVMTSFAELGFSPEAVEGDHTTHIRLHDCPFRELAKTKGDVVCAMHAGLLAGMLEAMGGRVGVDGLDPFIEPSLCLARLSER